MLSGTLFTEVTPATQGFLQRSTQEPTIECSDPTHLATVAPSSFPESAFIDVLAAFKSLPDFEQRLSMVNIYRQSLLHLAVHLRYRELVQKLVDWGVDLNIKDMNGFTALHTAYLCGDLSITRMLEQHGTIQLSLDILGRPPLELASGAIEDHHPESHLNSHQWERHLVGKWRPLGCFFVLIRSPASSNLIRFTVGSGMPPPL